MPATAPSSSLSSSSTSAAPAQSSNMIDLSLDSDDEDDGNATTTPQPNAAPTTSMHTTVVQRALPPSSSSSSSSSSAAAAASAAAEAGADSGMGSRQLPRPFPVDSGLLEVATEGALLAGRLVKLEEAQNKSAAQNHWFKKQADAMGLAIDDDLVDGDGDGDSDRGGGRQRQQEGREAARLRQQLREWQARPVRGRGRMGAKAGQRKKRAGTTQANPQQGHKMKQGKKRGAKKKRR